MLVGVQPLFEVNIAIFVVSHGLHVCSEIREQFVFRISLSLLLKPIYQCFLLPQCL